MDPINEVIRDVNCSAVDIKAHSFAAFLISFSIMGTSIFAFSISLLYNFYIFIVQKVEYTKKENITTAQSK